jgi:hypothetical protein
MGLWAQPEGIKFDIRSDGAFGPVVIGASTVTEYLPKALKGETPRQYCDRIFLRKVSFAPRYAWCFSPNWHSVDNTSRGCAQRIFQLISRGLPPDYAEQILGKAPLSYTELVPELIIPAEEPQYEGGQFEFSRISLEERMNKEKG